MTTLPETPDERAMRRAITLRRAAADLAHIELMLIVMGGAGIDPLTHDSGMIHGATDAKPDPHWRVDASLKGAKHEPETLRAKEIRERAFGKRICQQHAWINCDHVGRCMFCGEPLKDSDPELPEGESR